MDRPPWLDDEAEVIVLLETFIKRLEERPREERKGPLSIKLNPKTVPALFRIGEDADKCWHLLKSLDGKVFDIKPSPKRGHYEPEYAGASLHLRYEAEPMIRRWLGRPRQIPYAQQWRSAVAYYAGSFADGGAALARRPIAIKGKSADEIVAAFAAVGAHAFEWLTLRQLSSHCFWGHSKFLDPREPLLRELFPTLHLRPRPVLINVHLPANPEGVLFVENQDTYAAALGSTDAVFDSMALVYTAGFTGSADRVRDDAGVHLHYSGNALYIQAFEAWWFGGKAPSWPLWFWGDLDFAGLSILKALRRRFGEVGAWRPGYQPMLDMLGAGEGHGHALAGKDDQRDPGTTGCPYADRVLLPALRRERRFVDQESICR